MSEEAAAKKQAGSRLAGVLISNATVILSATGASLAYAGYSYYERLFAAFGLDPFLLELGNINVAAHGTISVVWIIQILIGKYWKHFALTMLAFTAIGVTIALGARLSPRFRRRLEASTPYLARIGRLNSRVLKWAVATLIFCVGMTAGDEAAKYDIRYFQSARKRALNCYAVDGTMYRGVVLRQDRSRTILIQPSRTTIIKNEDLAFVTTCRTK